MSTSTGGLVILLRPEGPRILLNAVAGPPAPDICEECGSPLPIGTFPLCGGKPERHGPVQERHFQEWEVELDGTVHRITSLQDADRIERESWARYNSFDEKGKRRGAPLVFRGFHQNRSNADKNALDGVGLKSERPVLRNSRGEPLGYAGLLRRRS